MVSYSIRIRGYYVYYDENIHVSRGNTSHITRKVAQIGGCPKGIFERAVNYR